MIGYVAAANSDFLEKGGCYSMIDSLLVLQYRKYGNRELEEYLFVVIFTFKNGNLLAHMIGFTNVSMYISAFDLVCKFNMACVIRV